MERFRSGLVVPIVASLVLGVRLPAPANEQAMCQTVNTRQDDTFNPRTDKGKPDGDIEKEKKNLEQQGFNVTTEKSDDDTIIKGTKHDKDDKYFPEWREVTVDKDGKITREVKGGKGFHGSREEIRYRDGAPRKIRDVWDENHLYQVGDEWDGTEWVPKVIIDKGYFGYGPCSSTDLAQDAQGLIQALSNLEPTVQGNQRNIVTQAQHGIAQAIKALDAGDSREAFRQAAQVDRTMGALQENISKQGAPQELLTSLRGVRENLKKLVGAIGKIPYDFEVWTPSRVVAGEQWTGMVVAATPTGYEPYDGELVANGQVVQVDRGSFTGPVVTALGTAVVVFGLTQISGKGEDRKSPPIVVQPTGSTPASPTITSTSNLLHPRDPMLVVSGTNLDQVTKATLRDSRGGNYDLPVSAGSSVEKIYLAPPLPPGEYKLVAETKEGKEYEAPGGINVPQFRITATPILHVGQKGEVKIETTSPTPIKVEIEGGEPQISLNQRATTTSQDSPGVVPYTANQVGEYTITARPVLPQRADHQAVIVPVSDLLALLHDPCQDYEAAAQAAEAKAAAAETKAKAAEAAADTAAEGGKDAQKNRNTAKAEAQKAADARKEAADARKDAVRAWNKCKEPAKAVENAEAYAEDKEAQAADLEKASKKGSVSKQARVDAAVAREDAGDAHARAGETEEANKDYKKAAADYKAEGMRVPDRLQQKLPK